MVARMMAPSRTLGKGRVLGTASKTTSTSELQPPPSRAVPERVRTSHGLLSPSPSSASLNSQNSSQKSSLGDPDISAAVALEARDNAEANTRMACPICNEEMVTLLQLNRHLDDDHKNLEATEQDEVKTWFKTQMVKAKKFQPLAVLNQKLKGLDIFESNENAMVNTQAMATQRSGQPPASVPEQVHVEPESLVTKDHWQRYSRDGLCSDPMCGLRLGSSNGNVNCRKCGKLFCDTHTLYQMKLSRSAQHEPVRGFWLRVCETCYISRDGYNDHNGFQRDHMLAFAKTRRATVDKSYLEASRLEKRLTKLTRILTDGALQQQDQGVVAYFRSFSGVQTQQRLAEQSIVEWEDDATVLMCPFCHQEFSNYSFRRHHCRLCGRVVCADPATQCSVEVGLNVATNLEQTTGNNNDIDVTGLNIRMCQDCKRTVFSKGDFEKEINMIGPDQKAFQNLKQFETGIKSLLPRFQKLLTTLQNPQNPPTATQLAEATKVRKRLTDAFTQYTVAAQRLRNLPTTSPTQDKLQKQIYMQASQFLHIHMLTLKSVPKILKSYNSTAITNHNRSLSVSSSGLMNQNSSAADNGYNTLPQLNGRQHVHVQSNLQNSMSPNLKASSVPFSNSPQDQVDSTAQDEKKAQELHEQLVVLEEQKFMIGEMLNDAQRRRKFDDVESLARNMEDIERELETVRNALSDG